MNVIRRVLVLFVVPVCLATSALSRAEEAQLAQPVPKLELADGDAVVFLGDSITHQCLYTQYVEDYFYTRFPKVRAKFHNAGVGGAKAWDALQRFDRDIAAYKPKYVTLLLGMNDGTYQPFNQSVFDTYQKDMIELIDRIKGIGATPILMTPTMYDARAARITKKDAPPETIALYNSVLAYYGTWLRDVAVESGYGFVDMYSPLNNLTLAERKTDANFTIIRDAVHPDAPGQLVMACAILTDMSLPHAVSNIRIVKNRGGETIARPAGGEVTDLAADENGVEFTWTAQSLPLVVPEEADLGVKLVKLGHRLSREALQVLALSPGAYDLTIDGEAVGRFQAAQLARGVELEQNPKTPQHRQAAEVAELNRQRNAGPVHDLRDRWRDFQELSRLRMNLEKDATNTNVANRVKELEAKLENLEEFIAEKEKAANELEDRIFQVNQPQPRKYVLKRAGRG